MTRFESAGPGVRAAAIAAAVLSILGVIAIGAMTIALIGLGRFSGDVEPTRIPAWFLYYRHDPEVRRWLVIGGATTSLIILVLSAAVAFHRRRPLHGAARWASASEQHRAGLRARQGLILGRVGDRLLIADGPDHVMLYAPTRTGKGVGVVIPNLLAWPGSVVVLDIKRENYAASAGYRAEAGQRVLLFDPLARDGRTARFNPLGHIDRADPVEALDELQRMSVMLFTGSDHADPFWSEAARTGFIGVGAFVAESPERPLTLGEIYRQLTQGDPRRRFPGLIADRQRQGRPLSAGCVSALTDFCAASENTFASVRQSITSRMGLWLNPAVDAATSESDFDLRTVRQGRLSLYLGASPDNLLRVAPLYALLFQQLIDLNSRTLPDAADPPVLVLLDEFARLGHAPVLAHAFAWVAGYGLRLLPVIQSPSQLRALYGPDLTEDILTNCGLEILFAPKEMKIAQDLSERLGYYTYSARSRSRPSGLAAGRRSLTESDQRRALMLPQELMQLPTDRMIVLKAGLPPVRARKIVYYRERAFMDRIRPAPVISPAPQAETPPCSPLADADMDFDALARALAAEGLAPPPVGASEETVGDWIDRLIDTAVPPAPELAEARDR